MGQNRKCSSSHRTPLKFPPQKISKTRISFVLLVSCRTPTLELLNKFFNVIKITLSSNQIKIVLKKGGGKKNDIFGSFVKRKKEAERRKLTENMFLFPEGVCISHMSLIVPSFRVLKFFVSISRTFKIDASISIIGKKFKIPLQIVSFIWEMIHARTFGATFCSFMSENSRVFIHD